MKHWIQRIVVLLTVSMLLTGLLPVMTPQASAATCTVSQTADGRPYVAPTATGPGSGKVVGFDNTHGETAGNADWVLDGGFSDMACALAGQGYQVEEIRAYPLTLTTLNSYDVVVFAEPNIPLTTAEEQALTDYVSAGGGLLLVGDHYQADRNLNTWDATEVFNGFRRGHYGQSYSAPSYNYNGLTTGTTYTFNGGTDWLASAFGLRFQFNAMDLVDSTNNPIQAGNPSDPDDPGILAPSLTYNLTTGVNSVATYAGATIAIVDPTKAMGIIYPNKGSLKRWTYAESTDPVALYTDNVGTPAGGSATYGGIHEGAYVAIAKPSAGKVAAAGDSSLFEDSTPKYKREDTGSTKSTHPGWSDRDHDTLGINLVNWLATPDATVGIDASLRQPATQVVYDPYTLTEPISEPWSTPPTGYLWYDASTFKAGAYNGTTSGGGGGGTPTWDWNPIPANAYPGNHLAVYLDGSGLATSTTYDTKAYLYVTGSGTQVSQRYNRSTGLYADALTSQNLTSSGSGTLKRWEFWTLSSTTTDRALSVRLKVNGTTEVTKSINQVATGSYGYLTVEQSLGYSDGLHAALFTANGTLNTAVRVMPNADTTITLPAGTYTLDIHNDAGAVLDNVSVTIAAGTTVSLASLLQPAPTGKLLISEVFYDTPGTDDVEEWIELYNGTGSAINLNGYSLTDNVGTWQIPSATIAAGDRLVVARNTSGFSALYGFSPDLAGLTLALGNSGDRVILKDSTGAELDRVAWEGNLSGWTISASTGSSIYRPDLTVDTDSVSDWAATGSETPGY